MSEDSPIDRKETPASADDTPVAPDDTSASTDEAPETSEETSATPEETSATGDDASATVEDAPATSEETAVTPEDAPAIAGEAPVTAEEAPAIAEEAAVLAEDALATSEEALVTAEAGFSGLEKLASKARVVSVDALRGFDMFWIVGGDHFARALGKISESPAAQTFSTQLKHVSWEGFRFYDLIFPLFVFMLGMSVVFSLPKYVAEKGKTAAHLRLFRRFILIFILGALYDKGLSDMAHESPFSGVLQRMAWCYLGAALIFLNVRLKGQIGIFFGILIGYWILVCFIPHPDLGWSATTYAQGENFVDWFDHKFLPFKEEGQYSESEGALSTIPAIASALLGLFAALIIRNERFGGWKKVGIFLGAGIVMVGLGYLWGLQFPIIKKIWTSSYVLVAGGYSCILLGVFYCIVDVLKFQKWATPFIWIGANPLMIYLASEFIDFHNIAERCVGGPFAALFGEYGELLITTVGILFVLIFARFLYKKKIFLRV